MSDTKCKGCDKQRTLNTAGYCYTCRTSQGAFGLIPPIMQGASDGAAMRLDAMRGYYIVEIRPEQWGEIVVRLERIEQKIAAQEPFHTAQALIRDGREAEWMVLDHLLISSVSEDEATRMWALNALHGYAQLRKRQEEEHK